MPWKFDKLGGVDVVVDNVYNHLLQQGQRVLIAEDSWDYKSNYHDAEGREFIGLCLPSFSAVSGPLAKAKMLVSFLKKMVRCVFALKENNVDVINAHFPTRNLFLISLIKSLKLWRGRLVLSFHGSDVLKVDNDDWVWRHILCHADVITTCSGSLKNKLNEKIPNINAGIEIIYNGIDIDKMSKVITPPSLMIEAIKGKKYIICVANFVEGKRQDILVNAFAELANEEKGLSLLLVGGKDNGQWLKYLKSICEQKNITEHVNFLLDVPNEYIPYLLQESLFFVLPSRYESFGIVILEAGLAKKAVLTSAAGGVAEIITSGDTGILVPCEDQTSLLNGMRRLIADQNHRNRMANALYKRVTNHFSHEIMGNKYLNVMKPDNR